MIKPRKCLYCDKKFKRGRSDKLYCSVNCRKAGNRELHARLEAESVAAAKLAEAEALAAAELARTQAEAQARLAAQTEWSRQIEEDKIRAAQQAKRAEQAEIASRPINGLWDKNTKRLKPSAPQMKHQVALYFPLTGERRVLYPLSEPINGQNVLKLHRHLVGKPMLEFIDELGTLYRMTQERYQWIKDPKNIDQPVKVLFNPAGDNRWIEQWAQGEGRRFDSHNAVLYA